MIRHHSSDLTPSLSHYEWRITPLSCQDYSRYWSPLTRYLVTRTGSRISRAWLRRTNICLHHWDIESMTIHISASHFPLGPSFLLWQLARPRIGNLSKTQFILWQYFSLHAHNLYILLSLRRGVQDSTVGKCRAELAWCIINQYWKERLRRVMFCRNFSSAAASWVAEREAPLSLPVIHHQTTRNLNIPNNRPDKGTIPNKPTMIKTVFLIS